MIACLSQSTFYLSCGLVRIRKIVRFRFLDVFGKSFSVETHFNDTDCPLLDSGGSRDMASSCSPGGECRNEKTASRGQVVISQHGSSNPAMVWGALPASSFAEHSIDTSFGNTSSAFLDRRSVARLLRSVEVPSRRSGYSERACILATCRNLSWLSIFLRAYYAFPIGFYSVHPPCYSFMPKCMARRARKSLQTFARRVDTLITSSPG
jgi:hypothetical protein